MNINFLKNKIGTSYLALTLFVFLFLFLKSDFNGIEESDTASYIDVMKNGFNSDAAKFRPILYPLILKFSFFLEGKTTFTSLIFLQIIFFTIASVFLLYLVLKDEKISKKNIFSITFILLLSLLNPQSINYISFVLPESIPFIFFLLIAYFTIKDINNFFQAALFAVIIVIPIFFKPIWLIFIPLPLCKLLWKKLTLYQIGLNILVPIFLSIIIFVSNQLLISGNKKEKEMPTTIDVNLNLALIRCGLTSGAENTKLFNFLTNKKLINEIKERKWNN